jgi:hypothetical protein
MVPLSSLVLPHADSMADMKSAAFAEKMKAGPVAVMTFRPNGPPTMAKSLVLWFL